MAPRADVHAFYQMTVDESSDRPLLVVAAAVTDPPPVNLDGYCCGAAHTIYG